MHASLIMRLSTTPVRVAATADTAPAFVLPPASFKDASVLGLRRVRLLARAHERGGFANYYK